MGRKLEAVPFFLGGAGSPSNIKSPGPRPTSIPSGILIHSAVWLQGTWVENRGLCPFWGRGAGSPSNRMWPGPRPTRMSNFMLIYPTGQDRTGQTDRQTGRQRSDSIGRIVLQTVAQKSSRCNFCDIDVPNMLEVCRRGVRGRYERAVRLSTSGSKTRSGRTISSQNECFSRGDAARVCSQVKALNVGQTVWPFT